MECEFKMKGYGPRAFDSRKGSLRFRTLIVYIEASCEPVTESGCWIWTKALFENGYGVCHHPYSSESRAHRLAWTVYKGPIPDKVLVCHKCDTKSCINPNHLFLGTQKENIADMLTKGRRGRPAPPKKDFCIRGHPRIEVNGRRFCRVCQREAEGKYALKKKNRLTANAQSSINNLTATVPETQ